MKKIVQALNRNRALAITLAVIVFLFYIAIRGMETQDWVITVLRGLSVGAITFLVASGFSLIFGLMGVLNMAHGTMFMIGAYIGWTVVIRTDTFIDILTPALLVTAGFLILPVARDWITKIKLPKTAAGLFPWIGLILAGVILAFAFREYPITIWDPGDFANSPVSNSFAASQGVFRLPMPKEFNEGVKPIIVLGGLFFGGMIAALGIAGFSASKPSVVVQDDERKSSIWKNLILSLVAIVVGVVIFIFNTPITEFLFNINQTWVFLLGILVALGSGALIGAGMEVSLIRPIYERHDYILILTLGLSSIGIEVVRAIWGLQEFTLPRPSIFDGTGEGCPAESLGDLIANQCSTISILGGRVRTYNEVFIPLLGILVLVLVWILLKRTRLGMIVRAGVQDREMVEALGVNVRQVFTLVFALGVGLAALGGIIGAPSTGLTTNLGVSLILNVLIALSIGGLTSYPGAALGSLMVGMLQQFIIKYGQLGINIPFLEEPFKPSPPLVPATTMLMMVIILLVMPQGLLGRKE